MIFRCFRRGSHIRLARVVLLVFLLWTTFDILRLRHTHVISSTKGPTTIPTSKIFIASIHWNNEFILRTRWNAAVLSLVQTLGIDNVFVSIYESGSWDDSKAALEDLNVKLGALGVSRKVLLDPTTHADVLEQPHPSGTEGWITTARGEIKLRRIPYLAKLRNLVMRPLHEMREKGEDFDRILWLGDVVFTPKDVLRLLATREGEYAAACSLDFAKPPAFYDTFALRDFQGHAAATGIWPFFRADRSRKTIMTMEAVPVRSCWNGIVAMDAKPFYSNNLTFRGVSDSLATHHIEGSECCLIHADNPLSSENGVWINPNVRVGYTEAAYNAVDNALPWPSTLGMIQGLWLNRLSRWLTTTWFDNRTVQRRLASWKGQGVANDEPGAFCLINEMQVLVHNGWAHV